MISWCDYHGIVGGVFDIAFHREVEKVLFSHFWRCCLTRPKESTALTKWGCDMSNSDKKTGGKFYLLSGRRFKEAIRERRADILRTEGKDLDTHLLLILPYVL
jgi:hypothetical protein